MAITTKPDRDEHDRLDVILELLETLQALPKDMKDVKAILNNVQQNNELCFAVLKEQGWLLKDHQTRLSRLEIT